MGRFLSCRVVLIEVGRDSAGSVKASLLPLRKVLESLLNCDCCWLVLIVPYLTVSLLPEAPKNGGEFDTKILLLVTCKAIDTKIQPFGSCSI